VKKQNHSITKTSSLAGKAGSLKTQRANFIAEIEQLPHQLRNVKFKTSMRDTVLQQRERTRY
jgi:hypothetical protein